jgi:two-component system LytT family response regulator
MIPALIVDDEKHQQELLTNMLHMHFPQIDLKGVCNTVDDGILCIKQENPQLIFLDINLPPKTGFDLLAAFSLVEFDVIFTTSYDQYALQALKLSAVDYLLKPFGLSDLKFAIEKFESKRAIKNSLEHIQTLLHNVYAANTSNIRIALPTNNGFVFVSVGDIIRCQADNVYTTFFMKNGKLILVSKSIKECETLLNKFNFFRANISNLINMQFVRDYKRGKGGTITMNDGATMELSRLRKEEFIRLLTKF